MNTQMHWLLPLQIVKISETYGLGVKTRSCFSF